jgi:hypothetical protein
MNIAFGTLSFFLFFLLLHGEQHFDIYNLVKMPGNSIELGGHIGTQCRGDFEVVTADRQVHEEPPVALGVKKTVFSANGRGNRLLRPGITMPPMPSKCNPAPVKPHCV